MTAIDKVEVLSRRNEELDKLMQRVDADGSVSRLANGILRASAILKTMPALHKRETGRLERLSKTQFKCSACGVIFRTKLNPSIFALQNRFCKRCGVRFETVITSDKVL